MPRKTPRRRNDFDLQSLVAPVLFIFLFQLLLPVFAQMLVLEKEQGLAALMRQMGLSGAVYRAVSYLFFYLLYVAATLLLVLVALALRFRYFSVNGAGVYAIFFLVWCVYICCLAFDLLARIVLCLF